MAVRQLKQFLFILYLFFTPTISQRVDYVPTEEQLNRHFFWSDKAPLTKAINEVAQEAVSDISLIIHHAERVERAVLQSLKGRQTTTNTIVKPCYPPLSQMYLGSLSRVFGVRGFLEPAWNCGTDVSGVKMHHDEEPGYTVDELYDAIFNRGATIKRNINEIAHQLINNFTKPEMPFNFTYQTVSANCVLSPACMYRQGEHWRHEIGIHNYGKDDYVPDGSRQSILEHFRVVNGKLDDLMLMRLPVYNNGTTGGVIMENATTIIQQWRAAPNPSCFRIVPTHENPALLDSLELADHSAQQAEDALTSSNLAILLLPLVLNFVPVSLFADVSTMMLLLYTIMSDVLTVIPLAIKGVDLVIIHKHKFRAVVTRMMSPGFGNVTIPQAAGGEIWAAECRMREEVGRTGIALIIISVVCLGVGVGAEIAARIFLLRRRGKPWMSKLPNQKDGSPSGEWYRPDSKLLQPNSSLADLTLGEGRSTMAWEVGANGVDDRYSFNLEEAEAQSKTGPWCRLA